MATLVAAEPGEAHSACSSVESAANQAQVRACAARSRPSAARRPLGNFRYPGLRRLRIATCPGLSVLEVQGFDGEVLASVAVLGRIQQVGSALVSPKALSGVLKASSATTVDLRGTEDGLDVLMDGTAVSIPMAKQMP